ncbi:MAG: 4-hydroxy-tetrahydrodipicolinate synthase [Elusimicrobia bacterium]|nr:4-hydroxy-tetrahydrodipicolinate synthase [Elusimicrobiota bacterium]
MKLRGILTALATPFKDGAVDWASLEHFVRWQIEEGVGGLVPCGTTGESPALSEEEHLGVIRKTVEIAKGRVPVLAGCGGNATKKTLELATKVSALGVDALLVVTPYYNKPTQQGLYHHYAQIAAGVRTPICIYNVPGRTSVNIEPATVLRLAKEFPTIKAIKESSGNLDQASAIIREAPEGFAVLSGDDSLTLPMLAVGAAGAVSVVGNVAPRLAADCCAAWDRSDIEGARQIHLRLFPLVRSLFVESNPAPVKWALKRLGRFASGELRAPLVEIEPSNAQKVERALRDAGLIKEPVTA